MDQKVAIVTAASRGMGAASARELAALGWNVVLLARSEEVHTLARELGGAAVQGSITEPADLERLVRTTVDTYGRIDAVVTSTGHPPKGPLLELSDDQWRTGLDMILLNVVRLARLVTPVMQAQRGGAFVNISSFAAFEPNAAFPISSALRAALASFAKLYAEQYAAEGIRMNNLLPGYVESYPITAETAATIPMKRAATVREIAHTVAFLVGPESSYITGQNLIIDGGLTRAI